jgi:hypothetical protein
MHKHYLWLLFAVWANISVAQTDSVRNRPKDADFRRLGNCIVTVHTQENFTSFGIVPELQAGNTGFALGLVKGYYTLHYYENLITGLQTQLNVGYLTADSMLTTGFSLTATASFPMFGGHIGVRGINYNKGNKNVAAVRPQAGINWNDFLLSYGYDFLIADTDLKINRHNITLSWFIFGFPRLSTRRMKNAIVPQSIIY